MGPSGGGEGGEGAGGRQWALIWHRAGSPACGDGKPDPQRQREAGAGRPGAGERGQARQCRTADHQGDWCVGEGRRGRARSLDHGSAGSAVLFCSELLGGCTLPALLTPAVRLSELRLQKLAP